MDPKTTQILLGVAGAASADPPLYVDDVFSTNVYTGTGSSQTITHNIDLAGEGGLIWMKSRSQTSSNHALWASETTGNDGQAWGHYLSSNDTTAGQKYGSSSTGSYPQVTSTSHTTGWLSTSSQDFVNWTFRKAPGFIDVVTYTGNGSVRTISHSLGSVPGFIIVKRTDSTGPWICFHRSLGNTKNIELQSTNGEDTNSAIWNNTDPTSTNFTVGTNANVNGSGRTFVAYIFAHDEQSFGAGRDESIIKCDSYTGNGSTHNFVNVGFEPQWLLIKRTDGAGQNWHIFDVMRGMTAIHVERLYANTTDDEEPTSAGIRPNGTGFTVKASGTDFNGNNYSYAYVAIRRPHKPAASGADVLSLATRSGTGSTAIVTAGTKPADLAIIKDRGSYSPVWVTRMRHNKTLLSNSTNFELTSILGTSIDPWDIQNGIRVNDHDGVNASGKTYINLLFRRAAGAFDIVNYTGTSSGQSIPHNLGVPPELIIVKRLDSTVTTHWGVDVCDENIGGQLNLSNGFTSGRYFNGGVSSTHFTTNYTGITHNTAGGEYIAYLFASRDGVSKVGLYQGDSGDPVNVDCGFTNAARFVLAKRTNSSGDWFFWDSARGIESGNDPYLLFNSNATEVSGTDYIDPLNAGFTISASAPSALNTTSGYYLFLAIAN